MKVLYIITQAHYGGAQHYVLQLAANFPGSEIVTGPEAGEMLTQATRLGISTNIIPNLRRAINPWSDILATRQLHRLIKLLKPDVIHANSSKAGVIAALAGFTARVPVVYTAHGFVFSEPLPPIMRWFYRMTERVASGFRKLTIAVSDFDRNLALTYHITTPNKIVTIHNGIAPIILLSRTEAQNSLQLSPTDFNIGTVANHYHNKGLDMLIAVMAELKHTTPFHLTIIGNGPERANLEDQIKKLGLRTKVTLYSPTPPASKYLSAFDLFVFPSRKEGFPLAILEALQAGLPILATRVGGVSEALGEAGVLVEPNAQTLLAGLQKLINDPEQRSRLSQLASTQSRKFTAEQMVAKTRAVYELVYIN